MNVEGAQSEATEHLRLFLIDMQSTKFVGSADSLIFGILFLKICSRKLPEISKCLAQLFSLSGISLESPKGCATSIHLVSLKSSSNVGDAERNYQQ